MASLVNKWGWYEWLVHTNFSFLTGASFPGEYVRRADAGGYAGLAITDYDGVYGIARAFRARRDAQRGGRCQNLRLFYGAEFHLQPDHDEPIYYQDTVTLLALNARGYQQLCEISTYAHRAGKKNPYLSWQDLCQQSHSDLVLLQPMRGIMRTQSEAKLLQHPRFAMLRELFPERSYLVASRHMHPLEDKWLPRVVALSRRWELPILMAQDTYFHRPQEKDLSDLLHAIRRNETMDQVVPHLFVNAHRSLHSLDWLERVYGRLPFYEDALRNSRRLSERFYFDLDELRYRYPSHLIPGNGTAQEYLACLVEKGARQRYPDGVPGSVQETLQHELKLIALLGFADYFLTVWDIVSWARQQDILCQGRGSAANSAVCYVLGITSIDPSRFELLFERFISVERGDPPDIDVDFEHERREEVIQYIYQHFGRRHAAMVANVICFKSRGAMRAVGKALGMPLEFIERSTHILDSLISRARPLHETVQMVQETSDHQVPDYMWNLWAECAQRLRGFPRHLGIHSGGFVLSDQPITQLMPQEPATMPGRTVVQWCKEDIEALGFFKIDVLSLGMLTAMRKCFDLIKQHEDQTFTLANIPPDDGATYAMIHQADTVGVFQIESRAQMSMLPRLRPASFYDLVVEVAIVRPGPIQGGMIQPYLRRRQGLEQVTYPDPRLKKILARTYGVPIFQEQVMRVAMAVGGFSAGEADELRKNIGSFSMKGDVSRWIGKLENGMRAQNIQEDFIQGILGQIKGFASYGFPESHAASFALLAYASAYLKCHHPAAFFAALMNSQPMGFYAVDTLIKTARHAGVTVLPICVQYSTWDHQLERTTQNGQTSLSIRLGLRIVRCLSERGAHHLVNAREQQGGWSHISHFLQYAGLGRVDLTALAAAQAFKCFDMDRRAAIWLAEAAPISELVVEDLDTQQFPAETPWEEVQVDYMASRTSLGPHPAVLMKKHAWCYPVAVSRLIRAKDLVALRDRQHVVVFGMVLVRQAPPTAKGMMFMTLEDESGMMNLVVRPQVFRRYHAVIDGQSFLCAGGILERGDGVYNIMVQQVLEPQLQKARILPMKERPSAKPQPESADRAPLELLMDDWTAVRQYT